MSARSGKACSRRSTWPASGTRTITGCPAILGSTSQHRVNWGLSFTVAALNGLLGTALDVTASCEAATYRRTFDAFVNYATSRSGATVFVDGTKSVVRALYLMSGQERPSRVIHLFRDPRGVAWSQMSRGQVGARAAARSWRFQHEFATVALRWLSLLPAQAPLRGPGLAARRHGAAGPRVPWRRQGAAAASPSRRDARHREQDGEDLSWGRAPRRGLEVWPQRVGCQGHPTLERTAGAAIGLPVTEVVADPALGTFLPWTRPTLPSVARAGRSGHRAGPALRSTC